MTRTTHYHILLGILTAATLIALPSAVFAATLSVFPLVEPHSIGQTFPVTVRVNTQGVATNALQGTLSFDPAQLHAVSLSTAGSIFSMMVKEPTFSNATGTVTWAGVILNPGFTGSAGTLFTVTFEAVTTGQAQVLFTSNLVLANDGKGTRIATTTLDGSYPIGPVVSAPLRPLSTGIVPGLPILGGQPASFSSTSVTTQPGFPMTGMSVHQDTLSVWGTRLGSFVIALIIFRIIWYVLARRRKTDIHRKLAQKK